jgi:hypothetical protein
MNQKFYIVIVLVLIIASCTNSKSKQGDKEKQTTSKNKPQKSSIDKNKPHKTPGNVKDYYFLLPSKYFICDAMEDNDNKENRRKAIKHQNIKNGYIKAKPQEFYDLEVALFKNREENKDIIATFIQCGAGCMCNVTDFLLYDNKTGKWKNITSKIFPSFSEIDKVVDEPSLLMYKLPEFGTTIEGIGENTGKTEIKSAWDGKEFAIKGK